MSSDIFILHNLKGLEYDVYGLFKAFLPEHNIKITLLEYFTDEIEPCTYTLNGNDKEIRLSYFNNERLITLDKILNIITTDGLDFKSSVKKALYLTLSQFYHKELPWGTLTGIRPIKLIAGILNTEKNDAVASYLIKDRYLVSEAKTRLAIDIAKRQRPILDYYRDKQYSLYISVPFCPSICSYCSFSSGTILKAQPFIDEYVECLCMEIEYVAGKVSFEPCCIYIGGGTPSTLTSKHLDRLFSTLAKSFKMSRVKEITFEAGRPDSMDRELFDTLKRYKITRISINPQTMNDATLKRIGRRHTEKDIADAFYLALDYGYNNINSDIIIGLPKEGYKEVEYTLDKVLELPIKSLTIHSLAVKKGSKLRENIDSYNYIINKDIEKINALCVKKVSEKNMYPYYLYRQKDIAGNLENIGYSYDGYEGLYNILILEESHNIIGVGAGAVTKLVKGELIKRVPNIKDALLYIERFDEMLNRKILIGDFI